MCNMTFIIFTTESVQFGRIKHICHTVSPSPRSISKFFVTPNKLVIRQELPDSLRVLSNRRVLDTSGILHYLPFCIWLIYFLFKVHPCYCTEEASFLAAAE